MTLVEEMHQQHLARQARLGGASLPPRPKAKNDDNAKQKDFEKLAVEVASLKRQLQIQSEIIGKLITTESDEKPRFGEIIECVCEFYEVSRNDVMSSRRTGDLVMPRQIICYLGRNLTGMSFPQMGRKLGGRDHTTALHGANKIHRLMREDPTLADDISVLELRIGAKVMERRFGPNVVTLS